MQNMRRADVCRLVKVVFALTFMSLGSAAFGQQDTTGDTGDVTAQDDPAPISAAIDVDEIPDDERIRDRLQSILEATTWFDSVAVRVDNGVVYLTGNSADESHREWATDLVRNTEGAVAVVNNIRVAVASPWDLRPALEQVKQLAAAVFRSLPLVLVGIALLVVSWYLARGTLFISKRALAIRMPSQLLRDVLSRALSVLVFVLGVYVVLRISGLTGLAVTIIGGTGLLGLAIGFAFRDIAENFLASILISIQRPFAMGDLIELDGHEGFVQRVNTRATLIMTRDGNHVQIPNAIVYKQTIVNYTANPRSRDTFLVGIGYDDSIEQAQSVTLDVLHRHPAILDDPEPLVLVEKLAASTVNLRIFFWINIEEYSQLKVRSSVIRQVKSALSAAGISMPDEAREVVFPQGVPVTMEDAGRATADAAAAKNREPESDTATAHEAEGDLKSEDEDVERQAADARLPEGGANLL